MWLVILAMRRPITIMVALIAISLCSILALRRMQADIFPNIGAPAIYVVQPYGGMDPSQMESYITYNYEYYFFYINGIEHIESKSLQGVALMKLVFHPGTDMSETIAQVVNVTTRARANMPVGTIPPFVTRFDVGSVPVALLVFSSPNRTAAEMQDLAVRRVRPMLASIPGASAPPPFGASARSLVVRLDPERLKQYRISPEEAVLAINQATQVLPSGNVRIGDYTRISSTNAVVGGLDQLMDAPVRFDAGAPVYVRDIAVVENGTDIITGYAHVNGRRTSYIPVTKRADASTLAVIRQVRRALPAMRAVVPEDVDIRLEFDQSRYVTGAIESLIGEGLLGAVLTGLMVLVFLRDWRSALIVITTIPASLIAAVVWLWASRQSINIMTLGGLALAVGLLVDEASVEIENIHTHMASGLSRASSVLQACSKTAVPRLLSMLAILSVFVPSFFMVGVVRQMFVPLSLAVGFAMLSSYVISSTVVPVVSVWLMKRGHEGEEVGIFGRLRSRYSRYLRTIVGLRWWIVGAYVLVCVVLLIGIWPRLGTEIFPKVEAGQYQIRLRAPAGTRIERTEVIALEALDIINKLAGPDQVSITTSLIGTHPTRNPLNNVYLWMGGPHEAVLRVALQADAPLRGDVFKERFRSELERQLPQVTCSFEAGDIISQIMSMGSPTPIEIAVQGPDLDANWAHAEKIRSELSKLTFLRDLQYAEALEYPTLDVTIDRDRARQFGITTANVATSLVMATSSSRFIAPNFWRDPESGNAYPIHIEIPQYKMTSMEDVAELPVMPAGRNRSTARPLLSDVASLGYGTTMGQIDRYNMQRSVTLTANINGEILGQVVGKIRQAIDRAGPAPRGANVDIRGQIPPLEQTLAGLGVGLLLSIAVIFLLLVANFQSFRLALAVISTVPAVICGVMLMLVVTGTTLNVQSFMGAIMSIGISVANAILLVTFAEMSRREGVAVVEAALEGARGRLRAILMTAGAMIAGMIPLAAAVGTASEQIAPLGRAVIGGLAFATVATLFILPIVYVIMQSKATTHSPSLYPRDPQSRYYEDKA